MSPQEAEMQLEALALDGWSSSIVTNLENAQWTERKAGFEAPEEVFRLVRETVRPMFLALAELVGLESVLTAIVRHKSVIKTTLAQFECLEFVCVCVGDFGVSSCTPAVSSSTLRGRSARRRATPRPACRMSANAVFGTLYDQLGDAMRPLLNLEGWKPSPKDSVVAVFEGVGFSPIVCGVSGGQDGCGGRRGCCVIWGAASSGTLFGLVDVSAQNTKELLVDMANEGDKGVVDLTKSLKARLSDSNANLKTKAVQVIGVVAARGDQQVCLDSLLPFVAMALKNPGGRAELLGWTVEMTQMIGSKVDIRSFVENTIDALSDKSAGACDKMLLVEVFKSVGRDTVHTGCRGMVPAKMRAVNPMIARATATAFWKWGRAEFLEPRLGGKHIMMTTTALRIGEVYPAMLHVLERIVSGKMGEYQKHDADNKIAGQPKLGLLLAKLLVKTTGRELTLPTPFVHVDVVSIWIC
ncbi:hypothetical protein B5M09_012266 [Aphanomyces astaci]|uniref:TOG domain-containing protein n=1 Tax=Aphanomyces astaci TaxID=112090 RepID=A0A3R7WWW4_APHAT|nr:hypothetical protein B5M09_012266 [Aphanomyces astaci]